VYVDPTGHSFFKENWKQIVGGFVGALVGVLTFGLGFSLMAAGFWGGLTGGALTGGLEGGWRGALIGGAMGGALGAFGGWGIAKFGAGFGYGMLAASAGVSYGTGGTEGLEGFGAGVFGGLVGSFAGGGITQSLQANKNDLGYGGSNSKKNLELNNNEEATSIYGEKRVWVGYGKDQAATLKNYRAEIRNYYTNNKNVNFVENPSWGDFKSALLSKYDLVALHTHGGPSGLEFAGSTYHSLSKLSNITGSINAKTVGISSCFPKVQSNAWSSLNISTTNYLDLSATVGRLPFSNRLQGIQNVFNAVKEYQ